MKLSTMPKQFAAELLLFLAENEEFSSTTKLLDEGVAIEEVRALLREISSGLIEELTLELKDKKYNVKEDVHISKQAKTILSHLSSYEENALLKVFGIVDKL